MLPSPLPSPPRRAGNTVAKREGEGAGWGRGRRWGTNRDSDRDGDGVEAGGGVGRGARVGLRARLQRCSGISGWPARCAHDWATLCMRGLLPLAGNTGQKEIYKPKKKERKPTKISEDKRCIVFCASGNCEFCEAYCEEFATLCFGG